MLGLGQSVIELESAILERVVPDPKERAKAELELLKLEQEGQFSELKQRMSAIVAEAQSEDPFTSRARPSFLYVMYGLFTLCTVGSVVGIWFPGEVFQASENMQQLFTALPEELYWLFGSGYLGYGAFRSYDKRNRK